MEPPEIASLVETHESIPWRRRRFEQDVDAAAAAGAEVLFAPAVETVYPPDVEPEVPPLPPVAVRPGLEEAIRPGHFAGVCQVVARLFDIATPLPARAEIHAGADALTPPDRPGDHAQAMMDLGATICTPRAPACVICPLRDPCRARANGTQGERPVKAPKRAVPERRGTAWVARREDGAWLVETRDPSGMLGGMLGFPTTPWDRPGAPDPGPPAEAAWLALPRPARHGFSHFTLALDVLVARLPMDARPSRGGFAPTLDPGALPTAMRRVLDIAVGSPLIVAPDETDGRFAAIEPGGPGA